MSQIKVWNENSYPYEEKFRDNLIKIPPKGHVLMEKDEADTFFGTFKPPVLDGDGNHHPSGFKMLRLEPVGKQEAAAAVFPCNVCNYKASSAEDLDEHSDANHLDRLVDQELAEQRRTGKKEK
jgi:hypothetical protein